MPVITVAEAYATPSKPGDTLRQEFAKLTAPLHGGTPGLWEIWGVPGEIDVGVGPVAGGLAVAQVVTTNAHGFANADTTKLGARNAALLAAAPALHFALATLQAHPNSPRAHRVALDALALLNP